MVYIAGTDEKYNVKGKIINMDRQKFLEGLETASEVYNEQSVVESLIERAKILASNDIDYTRQYTVITIEELCELLEEEMKKDRIGIIEESADVLICIVALKLSIGITYDDLKEVSFSESSYVSPCSWLQKQLCKWLRGFDNKDDVISSISVVMRHINTLKKDYNISNEELNKAVNVKVQRALQKTKSNEVR